MSGRLKSVGENGPAELVIEIVEIREGESDTTLKSTISPRCLYVKRKGRDIRIKESNGMEAEALVKQNVYAFVVNFLEPSLIQKVLHGKQLGLDPKEPLHEATFTFEKIEVQKGNTFAHFELKLSSGPTGSKSYEQDFGGDFIINMDDLSIASASVGSITRYKYILNPNRAEYKRDYTVATRTKYKQNTVVISHPKRSASKIMNKNASVVARAPRKKKESTELSLCDQYAAHPRDPYKEGPGMPFSQLDGHIGVVVCEEAIARDPLVARYKMNLARAYNKLEDYDASF